MDHSNYDNPMQSVIPVQQRPPRTVAALMNDEQPEEAPAVRLYPTNHHITSTRFATSADPRGYIPVFEYRLGEHTLMIDSENSMVFFTGIWKALGHNKADIVKLIDSCPEIASQVKKVRGGYLKIQGTWLPYDTAQTLARRVAFNIRYDLVPIFGYEFPETCLTPGTPGFGRLLLSAPKQRAKGRPVGSVNRPAAKRTPANNTQSFITANRPSFGPQRTAHLAKMASSSSHTSYGTPYNVPVSQSQSSSPANWTFPQTQPKYANTDPGPGNNSSTAITPPTTAMSHDTSMMNKAPALFRSQTHLGHSRNLSAPSFSFGRASAAQKLEDFGSFADSFPAVNNFPVSCSPYVPQSGVVAQNSTVFAHSALQHPVPQYSSANFFDFENQWSMNPSEPVEHNCISPPNLDALRQLLAASEHPTGRRPSSAPLLESYQPAFNDFHTTAVKHEEPLPNYMFGVSTVDSAYSTPKKLSPVSMYTPVSGVTASMGGVLSIN